MYKAVYSKTTLNRRLTMGPTLNGLFSEGISLWFGTRYSNPYRRVVNLWKRSVREACLCAFGASGKGIKQNQARMEKPGGAIRHTWGLIMAVSVRIEWRCTTGVVVN